MRILKLLLIILLSCILTYAGVLSEASGTDGPIISSSVTDLGTNWTVNMFVAVTNVSLPFGIAPFFARTTYNGSGNPICGELIVWAQRVSGADHYYIDLSLHTTGAPNGLIGQTTPILGTIYTLTDTNYHQVTITHTSGNLWSIYIDGTFDSSVVFPVTIYTGCELKIAHDNADGGIQSCGQTSGSTNFCSFAEVSAFSRILNINQIKAMKGTPASLIGDPIYYYPFYFDTAHGDFGGGAFNWSAPQNPLTINHVAVGMPTGEGH